MSTQQQLPAKELASFKQLVKHYELKQYKKGIKLADQILKVFPDHGETNCMKGLILSGMSKKDEAFEFVRKGLKCNLKSHVCWHSLGLLYRLDRNYTEAMKCYRQALRFDPDNGQVLRDLSLLQLHNRDYDGYCESRKRIMSGRANIKLNWLAYAVGEHLRGNLEYAYALIESYESTFADDSVTNDVELSELLSYKVMLLDESGKTKEALDFLKSKAGIFADNIFYLENRAALSHRSGDYQDARSCLRDLLKLYPDNHNYARAWLACNTVAFDKCNLAELIKGPENVAWSLGSKLTVGNSKLRGQFSPLVCKPSTSGLSEALAALPQGDMSERMHILYSDDLKFPGLVEKYVAKKLNKGTPNTFALVREFIALRGMHAVTSLVEVCGRLKDEKMPPFAMPLLQLLHSRLLEFTGDFVQAEELINAAIVHTPTLPELHSARSRIQRRAGNFSGAAASAEEARQLDLADRYLNSAAVKSLLRCGDVEKAKETAMLFAKETATSNQPNLVEMQAEWWERLLGSAHYAKGETAAAFTSWKETLKHFDEFKEDELDFANYCFRRLSLRPFVEFIRMQDKIRSHRNYRRSVKNCVRALLAVSDGVAPKTEGLPADVLAEASKLAAKAVARCPLWRGAYKLSFEVNFTLRKFHICLRDVERFKRLEGSNFQVMVGRLAREVSDDEDLMSLLKAVDVDAVSLATKFGSAESEWRRV